MRSFLGNRLEAEEETSIPEFLLEPGALAVRVSDFLGINTRTGCWITRVERNSFFHLLEETLASQDGSSVG